jgi:hypothetical protein
MSSLKVLAVVGAFMLAGASSALAQDRGNFDPAQFRQRMMDRLKEQLGSTDEEWKVLQPKVEKVSTAQNNARGGGGFGGGGRGRGRDGGGGGGGGGDNAPQTPVARASRDLRTALENKDTPAADIQAKLAAYRDSRKKANEELEAARKELKELLTQRQEAILVVNGMLE